MEGGHPECVSVHAVFDNEEIGSLTKQGADSTFLEDVLRRINSAMGRSEEEYLMAIASSFMVSADNAHAVHPNHGDKSDPVNRPYMNEGIVIKYSTKYATDGLSAAVFRHCARKREYPARHLPTVPTRQEAPLWKYFQQSCGCEHSRHRTAPAVHAFPLRDSGNQGYLLSDSGRKEVLQHLYEGHGFRELRSAVMNAEKQ